MRNALSSSLMAGALLLGCARNSGSANEVAPPAEVTAAPSGAAAAPIEGDPASAWIEMTGAWAPDGACGDYSHEWRLEAEEIHHREAHCKIERLELLQNGVRTIAHCSFDGDDDRVEDAFKFIRRNDATLSIVNETNAEEVSGLIPCFEDMIP